MDRISPPELPAGLNWPNFHHPELAELFRYDIRMPQETLDQILALPSESLCADLELILGNVAAWEPLFRAAGAIKERVLPPNRSFVLHALNILAEKRLPENLSCVLSFARLPKATLSFWLGKFLEESLWEMIYHFVRDDFAPMGAFVREPALALPVRVAVLDCMAQIAWKQPVKRLAVFDWFKALFGDVLEGKVEMDGECLGWAVRNVVDLRGRGLMPEIRRMYVEMEVHQGIAGDLATVEKEMDWPVKSWARREIFDLKGRYAYMVATLYPSTPEEKETEVKLHRVKPPKPGKGQLRVMGRKKTPLRKGKKVGRNDPCPCGSGKKYKKCCGG